MAFRGLLFSQGQEHLDVLPVGVPDHDLPAVLGRPCRVGLVQVEEGGPVDRHQVVQVLAQEGPATLDDLFHGRKA